MTLASPNMKSILAHFGIKDEPSAPPANFTKNITPRHIPLLSAQEAKGTPYTLRSTLPALLPIKDFMPPTKNFVPDQSTAILMDMLTYKRVADSFTEEAFIEKFIEPLEPHRDAYGNYWVQIGDDPNILWSSHIDTVHHNEGQQDLQIKGDMVSVIFNKQATSYFDKTNCLGADDAAGMWLLLEMIKAQVPGVYVFHRDEESGGQGSSWVSKNLKTFFEGIEFAVAFDRKGYDSIITHQSRGRCCSNEFATSMAALLNKSTLHYFKPDDTGTFTDTANYTDLVGECTNISVGYFNAHGPTECLDLQFITDLRDTLITADFSKLVSARKPGEVEETQWDNYGDFGGYYSNWSKPKPQAKALPSLVPFADDEDDEAEHDRKLYNCRPDYFIADHPELVADFMLENGITIDDLIEFGKDGGYI